VTASIAAFGAHVGFTGALYRVVVGPRPTETGVDVVVFVEVDELLDDEHAPTSTKPATTTERRRRLLNTLPPRPSVGTETRRLGPLSRPSVGANLGEVV
jgi:hypothetical protein